ncbi:uncharacterized protein LOC110112562 [Dendrobium catenatum]|uniref:Uncharacterized protein n=1 Tax=Dendrobium catenatum TaxID=906689 RepID=A0A2I0X2G0_9ASPA|nr:uncharacterized protein LOC110112562 [Dendrobium catenatum]PKU82108.1 hypothetical protein MA16_Dca004125 [Dendrobium catenatum]
MANGCAFLQSTFSAGDRTVICPRPRRLFAASAVRPLRCSAAFPSETSDPKSTNDLVDILFPKQSDSTPPFFCGSPPSRSDNPVVHDARFGEAVLAAPVPFVPTLIGSGSTSAASRSGCTRVRYGLTPAAVRVEGFDCLDRESSRSRGIPAFA